MAFQRHSDFTAMGPKFPVWAVCGQSFGKRHVYRNIIIQKIDKFVAKQSPITMYQY